MSGAILLELSQATVLRGGVRILDELTLAVRAGEHTAIIGPNGSGKSTLIKLLTQQIHALARSDGKPAVRIMGRERWNVFDLRMQLGIVSGDMQNALEQAHAVNHLHAIDVVLSGFFATLGYYETAQVDAGMRARALAALEEVGVAHLSTRSMEQMSTGEARRVLIARALVHEPQALVLDEPTTGLDLVARHAFMQLVRRLARDGRTIILITHHFDEVIPEIQRVILLQHGRVAYAGDTDEILRDGPVSAVFGAPIVLNRVDGQFVARLD